MTTSSPPPTPSLNAFRPFFQNTSCEASGSGSGSSSSPRSFLSAMTSSWSSTPSSPRPGSTTSSPTLSTHSRESSMDSMSLNSSGPSTPSTPSHRRLRSREFWSSLGDLMGGHAHSTSKHVQRDEVDDELMEIDPPSDTISLTLPPSLPRCSLSADYRCSETSSLIPPSFYPGQSIPVVLTFELDRFSSLPHSLNPTLTMSLIGTLHLPNAAPRTIICVSVSLAEGLALWARDAQQTYARSPPRPRECSIDPTHGLPGGTYSLPLTVQVPSTPRLPPSFTVQSSTFAVTYALTVTLTCDDPHQRTGARVVLAEAAKPFEMMPETLPTRAPRYMPQSFWVKTAVDSTSTPTSPTLDGVASSPRRQNTRWTVYPHIPTTAFSPTSRIPLTLTLTPPAIPSAEGVVTPTASPKFQVLIRLALIRREHSSLSTHETRDNSGNGLIVEEEIISRWGWIETQSSDRIKLRDLSLPLMADHSRTWRHGMSTMLNVGPAPGASVPQPDEAISVSSTFHLAITLGFLSVTPEGPTLSDLFPSLPKQGEFTTPSTPGDQNRPFNLNMSEFKRLFPGTVKTFPLPIVVGSVSEPRGALHSIRWSDLQLDRSAENGTGRMIHGETTSSENGWIIPPPSYREALKVAPYEF